VYRHRLVILATFGAVLLSGLAVLAHFTSVVVKRFEGHRWNLPSRIYSDMFVLRVGDGGSPEKLTGKLERLFYQADEEAPARAGHFRRAGNVVEVFPRDFRYPGKFFRGFPSRIEFASGKVASIRDASGEPAPALIVEPELLGSVFGEELADRTLVRLEDLPQSLKDAVLVIEDRDFTATPACPSGAASAPSFPTSRTSRPRGPTLTQQLVKNLYLCRNGRCAARRSRPSSP
jgi:penicillin-binding protein 1B